MAQRTLGDAHLLDTEKLEHGLHHAHAAADHRAQFFTQTRQMHGAAVAILLQPGLQPI
ncbi:hypothetical protein D3C78_1930650 [compost metagenome]